MTRWQLPENRFFDPDPAQQRIARCLYESVRNLPLVCSHSHVDPHLFVDEDATFGTPTDLLVTRDHYVFRLLYSQGIPLESLGIPRSDGGVVERDRRRAWQIFADNFHLFRGTPTGTWLTHELIDVFGVEEKLTSRTAQAIYDQIADRLNQPEFRPRALFQRFKVEVLCTTDAATDTLEDHQGIRDSGWAGDIRPTFRPDALVNLLTPNWDQHVGKLCEVSGITVNSYATFIQALEQRRAVFRSLGATAADHGAEIPWTAELLLSEADAIFQRALRGEATQNDARSFNAHMLMEFARMSIEDGLVMQFHVGSFRDHNRWVYENFGKDRGCDIPQAIEFTRSLRSLLNRYGNDRRLTLIIFTLDESTYRRELGPLAGHYPAVLLGPPWWFNDSLNGMRRYFESAVETAGLQKTVGFSDDTWAFPSIPARHDLWRRTSCDWLAGLVVRGIVDEEDARDMAFDAAYRLAKKAYRFEGNRADS